MKPSRGWIFAVDSIQKIMVVKIFDRRKNPQDVQSLALYLGQIITLCLGLCCITNIVQQSVFVRFSRMLASRLKECKGCKGGNPLAGVFLIREERYSHVICFIRKRRLFCPRSQSSSTSPLSRSSSCYVCIFC